MIRTFAPGLYDTFFGTDRSEKTQSFLKQHVLENIRVAALDYIVDPKNDVPGLLSKLFDLYVKSVADRKLPDDVALISTETLVDVLFCDLSYKLIDDLSSNENKVATRKRYSEEILNTCGSPESLKSPCDTEKCSKSVACKKLSKILSSDDSLTNYEFQSHPIDRYLFTSSRLHALMPHEAMEFFPLKKTSSAVPVNMHSIRKSLLHLYAVIYERIKHNRIPEFSYEIGDAISKLQKISNDEDSFRRGLGEFEYYFLPYLLGPSMNKILKAKSLDVSKITKGKDEVDRIVKRYTHTRLTETVREIRTFLDAFEHQKTSIKEIPGNLVEAYKYNYERQVSFLNDRIAHNSKVGEIKFHLELFDQMTGPRRSDPEILRTCSYFQGLYPKAEINVDELGYTDFYVLRPLEAENRINLRYEAPEEFYTAVNATLNLNRKTAFDVFKTKSKSTPKLRRAFNKVIKLMKTLEDMIGARNQKVFVPMRFLEQLDFLDQAITQLKLENSHYATIRFDLDAYLALSVYFFALVVAIRSYRPGSIFSVVVSLLFVTVLLFVVVIAFKLDTSGYLNKTWNIYSN
jgi:hypothetical protein